VKDLFISHAEQDGRFVQKVASGLEERGFTTWYYERDSVPGPSYLLQTAQAIREAKAVILIISKTSLCSNQVTKEVVRAHEENKPFLPVLYKLSHVRFQSEQEEWREALGSAASITVASFEISGLLPRLEQGLQALNIVPALACYSSVRSTIRLTAKKPKSSTRVHTSAKRSLLSSEDSHAKRLGKSSILKQGEAESLACHEPANVAPFPEGDSLTLQQSRCTFSKPCLVNLASLGLTKEELLELVQGEFRSHINYFKYALANYPLPLRSGFMVYINKTAECVEFTGLIKCSANQVKLASWSDILALYRRSTCLAYREPDFDPCRLLLNKGMLHRITDLHTDLRVRISKHFATMEDLKVEDWMTGFTVQPSRGTTLREEMANLIVYHLRESDRADHEAFKIEELYRIDDMTLKNATGEIVMALELSLQHIHKVITAFPPIA